MNAATVASRILDLQARSILVIGDVMLDRFVDGKVNRLSPEAPVPVLEFVHETVMPGGAANVACNLAGLGCDVRLLSVSGDDPAGRTLAQLLGANLSVDFHQIIDKDRPTTTKTRFRADGQQVLRVDEEVTTPVGHATAVNFWRPSTTLSNLSSSSCCQTMPKARCPQYVVRQVIDIARKAGKTGGNRPQAGRLFQLFRVDHDPEPESELRNADRTDSDALEDIAAAASALARRQHRIRPRNAERAWHASGKGLTELDPQPGENSRGL